MEVLTGKPNGRDSLENGTLEVSADGTNFTQVASFKGGKAVADMTKQVKAIRITPAAGQTNWLVVRDIVFK